MLVRDVEPGHVVIMLDPYGYKHAIEVESVCPHSDGSVCLNGIRFRGAQDVSVIFRRAMSDGRTVLFTESVQFVVRENNFPWHFHPGDVGVLARYASQLQGAL